MILAPNSGYDAKCSQPPVSKEANCFVFLMIATLTLKD